MSAHLTRAVAAVLVVSLLFTSCASDGTGIDTILKSDRAMGAGIGALIGIGLAVAFHEQWGDWSYLAPFAGAAIGYVVGDLVARKREAYTSDREWAEAELESTREALEQTRQQNEELRAAAQRLDQHVAQLEQRVRAREDVVAEKQQTVQELDTIIDSNKQAITRLNDAIDYLTRVREESQNLEPNQVAELNQKVSELQQELAELEATTNQLAGLRHRAAGL